MRGKINIKSGDQYGRLTVIREVEKRSGRRCFLCQCDCGNELKALLVNLRSGHTKSCGCISRTLNGMWRTPTHYSWKRMLQRCENKDAKDFTYYGSKGIKVCERWHKFENFFEDMGKRPKNKTIDRINNNGNYEPGNCRWSSIKQQNNNKSNNHIIEFYGQKKTIAQWAELIGIEYHTLHARFKNGWSVQRALTTPVQHYG